MSMMKLLRAALVAAFAFIPFADAVAGPFANRHIRSISDISAPILPTLDLQFGNGEALDGLITFTRASTATYFDSAGVLQTAASGVARTDVYIYDGANWINRGFLIEDDITNLVFPSEDLTINWVNINTDEPTTNNSDPTGGTSAVEVAATSTADQQFAIYRSLTGLTAGDTTVVSAFISAGTNATFAQLVFDSDGGGTDGFFCNFNLSTGANGTVTAFAAGTATACGVTDLGGSFYRVWATGKIAAGTVGRVTIGIVDRIDAVGFEAADLADNDSIIPWGVQIEADSSFPNRSPTSYIGETVSGTVTRAADVADVQDIGWLNDGPGTFLVEYFIINKDQLNGQERYLWIQSSGQADFADLNVTGNRYKSGGTTQYSQSIILSDGAHKRAFAYNTNDMVVYLDGSIAGSVDTSIALWSKDDLTPNFYISNIAGANQANIPIKSIQYWPVRLDAGYLAARTAP